MKSSNFEAKTYWQHRLSGKLDIGVVGHRSLGDIYNKYIYRRRIDMITAIVQEMKLNLNNLRMLDVGCGSGFYTEFWKLMGITNYVGLDVSGEGISLLQAKYPEYKFINTDITEPSFDKEFPRTYDLITVFDVMYHIVDDHRASAAFGVIHSLLARNGVVLIFDQLTDRDYMLTQHVKFRSRDNYRKMLAANGLEVVNRKPAFLLLAPPVFGVKPVDIGIAGLYKFMGSIIKNWRFFAEVVGRSMYQLDRLLLHLPLKIPNHELLIIKKVTLDHEAEERDTLAGRIS